MRIGLVGWPGAGMSTIFHALGGKTLPGQKGGTKADSWPLVSVDVPDERLVWLRDHYRPRKYTPARIEFVDFPGVPVEAEKGKGELMHAIRDTDALCIITRDFTNPAYPYVRAEPAAESDLSSLRSELLFGDYAAMETRVDRLRTAVKKPTKSRERDLKEMALLERCLPLMEEGKPLREIPMSADERSMLSGFMFASEKSVIDIRNVAEERVGTPETGGLHTCCASIEAEIADLSAEERVEFLADYGIAEPFRGRLIRLGYEILGLRSFFTVGEDEVRAWTINAGDNAITAAGKIHSDLARGFIRAEVVPYQALHNAGGFKEAKAAGHVRLEGKDYEVQDGEIVNIRFSV